MKKIALLLIVALTLTVCSCGTDRIPSDIKDIAVQSDYVQYEYESLKQASDLIVKAEVVDELSEKNSTVEKDSDDPDSISGFHAVREIKILDVFAGKEKPKAGEVIKIIEDAAMDNGYYYHGENYETLQKGEEYILFLNKDNTFEEYSIISADNGKVCTSNLTEMNNLDEENFEVAVKALVEYESKNSESEKKRILESEVKKGNNEETSKKEIELNSGQLKYNYTDQGISVVLK